MPSTPPSQETPARWPMRIASTPEPSFVTSDDLMAGSDSVAQGLEFASGDMEIGAANAAGLDLEKHVAGTGFGDGQVFEDQRARNDGSGMVQDGGAHLAFYSRGFRSSNVVGMSSATVG